MADDIQSNIRLDIDSADAIASLKNLQRQIAAFHTSLARGSADAAAASSLYQQKLVNSINRTGQFSAELTKIRSTTEAFTDSLERNKFTMKEYFRYAGGASKTFGRLFKKEFDTVSKVAEERVKTLQTQFISMGRNANGALSAIKIRPLALDMENLATKTAIAAQKQQMFNQLMKQGSTQLLNFGKNTQWAGRQLMVGFTVPLTMLGTTAAKTFMDMEKAVIKFRRVYGDMATSTADTNKMVTELKGLAQEFTKYGVAVADTMEMAAQAAAMGKMNAELTAQVAQATKLAVLGGVDQAQALETTISLTNAFGVAAEDLSGKIDFLNAVENQTVTSIEDLTIAVPKAGPVIQQLGGNVEDLAFFLTAMKEGGINASEGANALKSGLASMINPTAKASEFLAGFGVNLKGIVEANKGDVRGTVVGFAKALDTLDPLNRARAIEQLFGKFQFARISTLFKNVVSEGSQANKVLGLARQTSQELAILSEREMKKIESSPMFKFQKAIEDIKVALVPLGEAFLKAVTPLVQFGTKILEKFNAMDEGAKSFVTNLVGVVGVIGPALLMGFGLVANGVANIIKMFTGLKTIFNGVGTSSEDVAAETTYMTQAQLEAAAVAQSLDQAHASLIQRFSVEASALESLIQSYNRAIAAQAAFSGSPAGAAAGAGSNIANGTGKHRGDWKGYASGGIIKGKGTGTSDEVPLMASNGEAIIPAKAVKENPAIIASLLSGKPIGKFATGGVIGLPNGQQFEIEAASQKELANLQAMATTYISNIETMGGSLEQLARILGVLQQKTEVTVKDLKIATAVDVQSTEGKDAADALGRLILDKNNPDSRTTYNREMDRVRSAPSKTMPQLAEIMPQVGAETEVNNMLNEAAAKAMFQVLSKLKIDPDKIASEVKRMTGLEVVGTPAGLATSIAANQQGTIANSKGHITGGTNVDKMLPSGFSPESWITDTGIGNTLTNEFSKSAAQNGEEWQNLKAMLQKLVEEQNATQAEIDAMLSKMEQDQSLDYRETQIRGQALGRMIDAGQADNLKPNKQAWWAGESAMADTLANRPDLTGSKTLRKRDTAGLSAQIMAEKQSYAGAGVNVKDTLKVVGTDVQAGLAAGITEGSAGSEAAIGTSVDKIVSTAESKLQIKSPSRVFWNIGKNITNALAAGMKDNSAAVEDAAGFVADASSDPFGSSDPFAPTSGPLAPPTAPGNDPFGPSGSFEYEEPKSKTKKFASAAQGVLGSFGNSIKEAAGKAGQKAWMKTVGEKFAKAQGAVILDADGKVIYDGHTADMKERGLDPKTGQPIQDVRVVSDTTQKGKSGTTTSADGRDVYTAEGAKLTDKDIERATKRQQFSRVSGGVAKAAGVATAVTGAASMIPGAIGETAQKVAGPLAAFTTLTSFIQGPVSAAIVALVGTIGAMVYAVNSVREAFKTSQQEAIKLQQSMTGSAKSIRKLSEFSGKVTAGEMMDRVRKQRTTLLQTAPGKTTFGESFVKSEQGSELLKNARTQIANNKGNKAQTTADLSNQITMGVASGALSMEQARSMAANLAAELGDMNIGLEIQANLVSVLGPDGTDVLKNPLMVATKLKDQSVSKLQGDMDMANTAASKDRLWSGGENTQANRDITAGGAAAAGAGVGALGGFQVGSMIAAGAAATGVGAVAAPVIIAAATAIGAVGGAITGAVIASESLKESAERAGAMSGMVIADMAQALAQQKEMMDVLDTYYMKKMAEAEAEGDIAEYKRLQLEYDQKKNDLAEVQAATAKQVQSTYANSSEDMKTAIREGQKETMAGMFKDDPMQNMYIKPLEQQITDAKSTSGLTGSQEVLIRTNIINGNMTPEQTAGFMNLFGKDKASMKAGMDIMTNLGGPAAAEVTSLAGLIDDPKVKAQFLMDIKATGKDKKKADSLMKLVGNIGRNKAVFETDAVINFYSKNKKAADEVNRVLGELDAQKVTTVEKAYEIVPKFEKGKEWDAAFDENYFNNLKGEGQKELYTNTVTVWMNVDAQGLKDDPGFNRWLQEQGAKWEDKSPPMWQQLYADAMGKKVTIENPATDTTAAPPPPKGGGGGTPSSILDDLTNKLKQLRQIQVKTTNGWAESAKELKKWLGGNKDIKVFQGMKQQMRAAGAGEDLIELIAGMDPAEYEKKKNQLFEFDKKGNIIKLKDLAKATGKALKEIALGEFQNAQLQTTKNLGNQNIALKRLITGGLDVATAYATVEDAALAAALASKQLTDSELKKIIKATKEATAAMKLYQATQAVRTGNEDVAQNNKVIAKLATSNYSDVERKAILDNKDLQTLYLNRGNNAAAAEAFATALKNAVEAKQFEINAKKLTLDGLQELFQEKYDMAMERINAQETKINLEFDVKTKGDNDLIKKTEDEISDYNYKIDDLEASLEPIQEAEEKINEQYEKRVKALDAIAVGNEEVARQQKQQLTLADALSQGDIAAAARAMQEAQQANAAAALEKQKKALEEGKDKQIAGLVNAQGLTRVQVEEKIKGYRSEIFKLEENSLEPARRRVELAERERDALLASWEAEKQRLELAKNKVDVAKTDTPEYKGALAAAEDLATNIVDVIDAGGNVADLGGGTDDNVDPNASTCPSPTKTQPTTAGYTYKWNTKTCEWDGTKIKAAIVKDDKAAAAASVAKPLTAKEIVDLSNKTKVASTAVKASTALAKAAGVTPGKTTADAADRKITTLVNNAKLTVAKTDSKAKSNTTGVPTGTSLRALMGKSEGGMIRQYLANGGPAFRPLGTDTVPAMLTPGEFVVRKYAVDRVGVENLKAINRGASIGDSVYNYDINISVSKSSANEDDIARAVMAQIKSVDSQRIRGNRFYSGN